MKIENNHFAIINGKILTMSSLGIIDKGTILIKNSKIIAVGKDIKIPFGFEVFDAEGKIVTPGLIDAHTHLGIIPLRAGYPRNEGNESTNSVTPAIRALDGINPQDPGFKTALKGGVTTAMILPGSLSGPREKLNVIAGQGTVVKCFGKTVDEMVLRHPACMKMGLGDRPKKTFSPSENQLKMPSTRMGVASLIRTYLTKAKYYQLKIEKAKNNSSIDVEIDLEMEALSALLRREYPARIHAYRADDIYTAIRLSEEFKFDLILDHATESAILAEEIAKRNIPVVFGPIMHGKSISELEKLSPDTPAKLVEKGVKVAITSDHPTRPIEYLTYHAAIAAREGLNWWEALKTITINAAEILGVAHRVGSIEAGKDADIAIFSDDPLEPLSKVETVFINGIKRYP